MKKVQKQISTTDWKHFEYENQTLELPLKEKAFKNALPNIIADIQNIVEMATTERSTRSIPFLRPKGYLKRLIYQLATHCHQHGMESILRDVMKARIQEQGGRIQKNQAQMGGDNIFYLCLRGIICPSVPVVGGELTRISRQLMFALKNKVHPKFVIGYIYQTGELLSIPVVGIGENENWDDLGDPQEDFDDDGNYIGDNDVWDDDD